MGRKFSLAKKKKKKNKNLGPRRKRMNRAARLRNAGATQWVQNYGGNHIVKGYRHWYGVDEMCAVVELRLLGVEITPEQEERYRRAVKARTEANARRKEKKRMERQEVEESFFDYEMDYAYFYDDDDDDDDDDDEFADEVLWCEFADEVLLEEYGEFDAVVDEDGRLLWCG